MKKYDTSTVKRVKIPVLETVAFAHMCMTDAYDTTGSAIARVCACGHGPEFHNIPDDWGSKGWACFHDECECNDWAPVSSLTHDGRQRDIPGNAR